MGGKAGLPTQAVSFQSLCVSSKPLTWAHDSQHSPWGHKDLARCQAEVGLRTENDATLKVLMAMWAGRPGGQAVSEGMSWRSKRSRAGGAEAKAVDSVTQGHSDEQEGGQGGTLEGLKGWAEEQEPTRNGLKKQNPPEIQKSREG